MQIPIKGVTIGFFDQGWFGEYLSQRAHSLEDTIKLIMHCIYSQEDLKERRIWTFWSYGYLINLVVTEAPEFQHGHFNPREHVPYSNEGLGILEVRIGVSHEIQPQERNLHYGILY